VTSKETPLPGLDPTASLLEGLKPYAKQAKKQTYRQITAQALADRLVGGSVGLEWGEDGSLGLRESNPEEDAGPAESLASRFAALLLLSAQDSNHAVGRFDGSDGETFAGGSVLWKSSLRLDPTWMEAMRRRTRKTALARFLAMRKDLKAKHLAEWVSYCRKDRSWAYGDRFLTLTMNRIAGVTSLDEVRRFNGAFRSLTRSKYWASLTRPGKSGRCPVILGGIKAIEDALTSDGPHVHGHFLLIARRLSPEQHDDLHAAWTKALRNATRQVMGIKFPHTFETIKPDLRTVTKRSTTREGCISMVDALDEVCKYLTKPSDLLMPHLNRAGRQVDPPSREVLLDLCMVPRWPRMVEMLGKCRTKPQAKPGPSLDTSCISVSPTHVQHPDHWSEGGIEDSERVDFRLKCAKEFTLGYKIVRDRGPTWRQLMSDLGLHDWLQVAAKRCRDGQRFRKNWLLMHNPNLHIMTLDGEQIVHPSEM
jgi:hypothetical protein